MGKIKEILCMHHSHLDVGYTHPQNMLMQLQCDYIDQAIDLCFSTKNLPEPSQFRWTIEATYPLKKWLETASQRKINELRLLVSENKISIAALPMHTTPGCTAAELSYMMRDLDYIREVTGSEIKTAINHDVNGQPWTLPQILLDSGVEFYMTGINIHFGGIPFPRPYLFSWRTQDNKNLPTFLGEHYSLFSQFFFTYENDLLKMHEGVKEYIGRIEKSDWDEDYVVLTATNPPLYDNNSPDSNLAYLIDRYNKQDHEQKIRFITPEMLYERVKKKGIETLPIQRGDWCDYWNFGSASTARETAINRRAKVILSKAEYLASVDGYNNVRSRGIAEKAYENIILFDEHTWGASESVTDFEDVVIRAQQNTKLNMAYTAANLAATALYEQMEKTAGNLHQSDEIKGAVFVNTSGETAYLDLEIPSEWFKKERTLSAFRAKDYLPYDRYNDTSETVSCGNLTLPPFTKKYISIGDLKAMSEKLASGKSAFVIDGDKITTPYYEIYLDREMNKLARIVNIKTGENLIDESPRNSFFSISRETINPNEQKEVRSSIFPRDVDLGNRNISQWNYDWENRMEFARNKEINVQVKGNKIILEIEGEITGMDSLKRIFTFYDNRPTIGLTAKMNKNVCTVPESYYFLLALKLDQGWNCIYDIADSYALTDDEQMGESCRNWITIDKYISMFDGNKGVVLTSPDSPMMQIGGFGFGRKHGRDIREENPLLLLWPINNYWDTNFAASQDGFMQFNYELTPIDKFDPKTAHMFGINAQNHVSVGAVTSEHDFDEVTDLICGGKNAVPIFVRPAKSDGNIIVGVRNFSGESEEFDLTFLNKNITAAFECDVQEKSMRKFKVQNGKVKVKLNGNQLLHMKISFSK